LQEIDEVKGRTLIALAVKIGSSRLIDNCIVED
jgi:pantothenate synthetase